MSGTLSECLFCRIVTGALPSEQVWSTEGTYAFRDIHPAAPTHVLVVPREHVDDAGELGHRHADLVVEIIETAQAVARQEGIDRSGYRLVLNVGNDALNSVPHLHLHVLGGRQLGGMA